MNQHSPRKATGSLLERAAEIYDFNAVLRGKETQASPVIPTDNQVQGRLNGPDTGMPVQPIDRDVLRGLGFILPDSPVSSVSEEFRIIKRQLRSEEHTSELQSLMSISYAVFCLQ